MAGVASRLCEIVDQKFGGEVVGAVDDEVVMGEQGGAVLDVESTDVDVNVHIRIERAHTGCGELRFGCAAVGERVPRLTMQVGGLESIAIDEREPTDARTGKILQHWHPETSGAHYGDARSAQTRLSRGADFPKVHLPRVIGYPRRLDGRVMRRAGVMRVPVMRMLMMYMLVMGMLVMGMLGVGVDRRRRAALAVDPTRVTVDVVLLFPNRHTMLHFVDDVATGLEGFVAVTSAHAHPHGELPEREIADAMHAARVVDTESLASLGDDAFALTNGEFGERFVFEVTNFPAFVVITHPTFERGIATASRIREFGAQRLGLERRRTEPEARRVHGEVSLRRPAG